MSLGASANFGFHLRPHSTSFDLRRFLPSERLWRTVANVHRRWTMGSVLFLASWAVLMGPITYSMSLTTLPACSSNEANIVSVQHLFSGPRLPFTGAYFGSIALTIYFSIGVGSAPFVFDTPCRPSIAPCQSREQPCRFTTCPVNIPPLSLS